MAGRCKPGYDPRNGSPDLRLRAWYLTAMLLKLGFCLTLCAKLEKLADVKLSFVCIPLWTMLLGALVELGLNIFPERREAWGKQEGQNNCMTVTLWKNRLWFDWKRTEVQQSWIMDCKKIKVIDLTSHWRKLWRLEAEVGVCHLWSVWRWQEYLFIFECTGTRQKSNVLILKSRS